MATCEICHSEYSPETADEDLARVAEEEKVSGRQQPLYSMEPPEWAMSYLYSSGTRPWGLCARCRWATRKDAWRAVDVDSGWVRLGGVGRRTEDLRARIGVLPAQPERERGANRTDPAPLRGLRSILKGLLRR